MKALRAPFLLGFAAALLSACSSTQAEPPAKATQPTIAAPSTTQPSSTISPRAGLASVLPPTDLSAYQAEALKAALEAASKAVTSGSSVLFESLEPYPPNGYKYTALLSVPAPAASYSKAFPFEGGTWEGNRCQEAWEPDARGFGAWPGENEYAYYSPGYRPILGRGGTFCVSTSAVQVGADGEIYLEAVSSSTPVAYAGNKGNLQDLNMVATADETHSTLLIKVVLPLGPQN